MQISYLYNNLAVRLFEQYSVFSPSNPAVVDESGGITVASLGRPLLNKGILFISVSVHASGILNGELKPRVAILVETLN